MFKLKDITDYARRISTVCKLLVSDTFIVIVVNGDKRTMMNRYTHVEASMAILGCGIEQMRHLYNLLEKEKDEES